jgi:predicted SnoaL-like aldol condensation-catalyzing enzyme
MSTEENIAIARRWNEEGFNGHRLDLIDELFHPNYTQRAGTDGAWSIILQGREAAKAALGQIIRAYPKGKLVIEDIFGAGDKVAMRVSLYDNEGKLGALILTIYRIVDGQILDDWYCNTLARA